MAPSKINVLITSFPGAGLPPTIALALPPSTPISALLDELDTHLPPSATTHTTRFLLSTLSSSPISLASTHPISTLLPLATSPHLDHHQPDQNDFLTLRLTPPLPGGKGGFGSQLRAAGGRMSKRKKNANGAEENGSSRNLDGRRLRTVTEAKALAEYLAIKPEMERKEKEARRKRWQEIVDSTERRQDEIRHGKGKVGLDGKWVEDKEEVGERTREAVKEAMKRGRYSDQVLAGPGFGSEEEGDEVMKDEEDEEEEGDSGGSKATTPPTEPEMEPEPKGKGKEKEVVKPAGNGSARKFVGFDEDDEFMSSDEESSDEAAKA
ncbi:telomere stability and silencing-domain-containing protein [Staphylotrichum tortipilum]|uniref:Telomere stability and silencing-domain-containing protein n=1 Tax=Staphylotrichum tortipilum TaxID=2831512 RepID=A0AAN6RVV2_9PEZI|nr:telomere stability and silencing-domain-containing protein [Staphylotrichum longicolle]